MSTEVTTTFTDTETTRILGYLQANQSASPPDPLAPDPSTLTVEQFVASAVQAAMVSVNAWAQRTGVS